MSYNELNAISVWIRLAISRLNNCSFAIISIQWGPSDTLVATNMTQDIETLISPTDKFITAGVTPWLS